MKRSKRGQFYIILAYLSKAWCGFNGPSKSHRGKSETVPTNSGLYKNHEIISMVIRLPSADLFKKACCQLQAKVCAQSTG